MSNTTATQVALLNLLGCETSDDLFNLLRAPMEDQALRMIDDRIQRAFWDVESAESDYARALHALQVKSADQVEALTKGFQTEIMWVAQAAEQAAKAESEMKQAVSRFANFAAIRKAMVS